VEEVAIEVMKADKIIKSFQTMAIVSLNMGNFTFKVNTLKNRLVMGRRRRQCYRRN
jgi:hypothetical protein